MSVMRSDDGTNLVGAEKEMREAIGGEMFLQKGIAWMFDPPAGSHFGGVWKRLIRSVRKRQPLDDERLHTLLCGRLTFYFTLPTSFGSNGLKKEKLLQERQKWSVTRRYLKPGDAVLIVDDGESRGSWIFVKTKPSALASR